MSATNLNIRTDKDVKEQAEQLFAELGLNMTTAINLFLRTAIRKRGIPFDLLLDVPNDTTVAAIEEGKRLLNDPASPKYSNMEDLKAALDS
jgi:DNA-damage-inducible protein J